jgi:hypothetical protein
MPQPTLKDTAFYRLPMWAFRRTAGRFLSQPADESEEIYEDELEEGSEDAEDFEVLEKVKTSATNGSGKATRRSKKAGRGK